MDQFSGSRPLTFHYDNRNRLTEISSSDDTFDVKYRYDAFDRRISTDTTLTTTSDGGEGGTTTTTTETLESYVYDQRSSGTDNVVLDFVSVNGGTPSLEHRYLYGPMARLSIRCWPRRTWPTQSTTPIV